MEVLADIVVFICVTSGLARMSVTQFEILSTVEETLATDVSIDVPNIDLPPLDDVVTELALVGLQSVVTLHWSQSNVS